MNTEVFILHHSGLGDHIICNGLVRELLHEYERIHFPVKSQNLKNIERMFSDLSSALNFVIIETDTDIIDFSKKYPHSDILKLGLFKAAFFRFPNESFCQSFYRDAKVSYDKRWKSFFVPQNKEREDLLFKTAALKTPYIFVHDDVSRALRVNEKYIINRNVFRPDHNLGSLSKFNLFDYKKIICEADEIHCMDSSFASYIDHIGEVEKKPKFIHRYIRKANLNPLYRNKWVIINE